MIRLSAFADEISPDLDEQIAVLKGENIRWLDLRAAWDTNVIDLTDAQVAEIKRTLDASGIGVAAIGSPIGKVPIDGPFAGELRRFERAIAVAQAVGAPFVRIFSFYPPAGNEAIAPADPAQYRDEVLRRVRALAARAREAGLTLLHENERDIYGDTIERCVDLLQSINDAHLQAVFDPANFIACGQTPYPDGYEALRPWLRYVHVKDARADGNIGAAGEGVGRWPELLRRLRADSYDGVLSLEPHLSAAGQFSGFSGPDRFRHASQTLQRLLRAMGWEYA